MAGHLFIAVVAVNPIQEPGGEGKAPHEFAHADLATAQLGFEDPLAINLEGVEKELAVGAFN